MMRRSWPEGSVPHLTRPIQLMVGVSVAEGDSRSAEITKPSQNCVPRLTLLPMNVRSRSSPVLWCLEIQTNSGIGLLDSIYRSRERSIRLCLNHGGNPLRIGTTLTHRPTHQGLSADYEHPRMVVSVRVFLGIVVEEAERLAQEQNIVRLAGEKRPARSYTVHPGVRLEVAWSILLWT